ncbi:6372_t:CDS:2, partial [Racocetra persica]
TPSRIMPGSNLNEMDYVLYFAKPYSEWKLINFLKRKKYKQAQQDTNWKDEYETYKRHINRIFDEKTQKNLYKTYLKDKGSNEVKKFWSGWCQQYAKSDKNKILPEVQNFLGMHDDVLEQKSANWELLENQKQKSNNKLPSRRTIEDSLQEAIIQIQEKDSYYNHEIFSNIINTNDNDIKKIPSFILTLLQVNYIHLLIDNEIRQLIERINFNTILEALTMTTMENINTNADNTITNANTITNISNSNITMSNASTNDIGDKGASVFKKITGLTPYIKCVIKR